MKNLDVRVKISEILYSIRKIDRKMEWESEKVIAGECIMCTVQMLVKHSEYKLWLKSIYSEMIFAAAVMTMLIQVFT